MAAQYRVTANRFKDAARRADLIGQIADEALFGPLLIVGGVDGGSVAGFTLDYPATLIFDSVQDGGHVSGIGVAKAGQSSTLSLATVIDGSAVGGFDLSPRRLLAALTGLNNDTILGGYAASHTHTGFRPKVLLTFGAGAVDVFSGQADGSVSAIMLGAAVEAPPPGPHRYWRLRFDDGADEIRLRHLGLREQIGGASIAAGGTASASSNSGTAGNAFDASGSTYWGQTTASVGVWPQWIKYDFGAGNTKQIAEYMLGLGDATTGTVTNGFLRLPRQWQLEYSDDDANWWPHGGVTRTHLANADKNFTKYSEDRNQTPLLQFSVTAKFADQSSNVDIGVGSGATYEYLDGLQPSYIHSFEDDGFRWAQGHAGGATINPMVLALGGDAITACTAGQIAPPAGRPFQQTITTGFLPTVVLCFAAFNDGVDRGLSFGIATAHSQKVSAFYAKSGGTAGQLGSLQLAGRSVMASMGRAGSIQFAADGFTVVWPADLEEYPASSLHYVAIAGDFDASLSSLEVPDEAGDMSVDALAGSVAALLLGGHGPDRTIPSGDLEPNANFHLGVAAKSTDKGFGRRWRFTFWNPIENQAWAYDSNLPLYELQPIRRDGSVASGPLSITSSNGVLLSNAELSNLQLATAWSAYAPGVNGLNPEPAWFEIDLGQMEELAGFRLLFGQLIQPGKYRLERETSTGEWEVIIDSQSGLSSWDRDGWLTFPFQMQASTNLARRNSGFRVRNHAKFSKAIELASVSSTGTHVAGAQAAVNLDTGTVSWSAGGTGNVHLLALRERVPASLWLDGLADECTVGDIQIANLQEGITFGPVPDASSVSDWFIGPDVPAELIVPDGSEVGSLAVTAVVGIGGVDQSAVGGIALVPALMLGTVPDSSSVGGAGLANTMDLAAVPEASAVGGFGLAEMLTMATLGDAGAIGGFGLAQGLSLSVVADDSGVSPISLVQTIRLDTVPDSSEVGGFSSYADLHLSAVPDSSEVGGIHLAPVVQLPGMDHGAVGGIDLVAVIHLDTLTDYWGVGGLDLVPVLALSVVPSGAAIADLHLDRVLSLDCLPDDSAVADFSFSTGAVLAWLSVPDGSDIAGFVIERIANAGHSTLALLRLPTTSATLNQPYAVATLPAQEALVSKGTESALALFAEPVARSTLPVSDQPPP